MQIASHIPSHRTKYNNIIKLKMTIKMTALIHVAQPQSVHKTMTKWILSMSLVNLLQRVPAIETSNKGSTELNINRKGRLLELLGEN